MSSIWRWGLQHYRSCGARWGNRFNNMHPPGPCSHPMLTPLNYQRSHNHPKHDGGQPPVSSWPYSQPIYSQYGGNTHLGQAVVVYPKATASCLTSSDITSHSTTAQHEGEEKIDDAPTIEGVLEEISKVKDLFFSVYVDETEMIHNRLNAIEAKDARDMYYRAIDHLYDERICYLDGMESRGFNRDNMSKDDWIFEALHFCPMMTDILTKAVRINVTGLKEDVALTRGAYREHTEVAAKRQLQEFLDHILSESDCDFLETFGAALDAAHASYGPLLTSVVNYRAFLVLLELIIKHIVSCDSPEDMKKRVKEDVANGKLSFVLDEESKVLAEGKANLPVIRDDDHEIDEKTFNFLVKFYFEGGRPNYVP